MGLNDLPDFSSPDSNGNGGGPGDAGRRKGAKKVVLNDSTLTALGVQFNSKNGASQQLPVVTVEELGDDARVALGIGELTDKNKGRSVMLERDHQVLRDLWYRLTWTDKGGGAWKSKDDVPADSRGVWSQTIESELGWRRRGDSHPDLLALGALRRATEIMKGENLTSAQVQEARSIWLGAVQNFASVATLATMRVPLPLEIRSALVNLPRQFLAFQNASTSSAGPMTISKVAPPGLGVPVLRSLSVSSPDLIKAVFANGGVTLEPSFYIQVWDGLSRIHAGVAGQIWDDLRTNHRAFVQTSFGTVDGDRTSPQWMLALKGAGAYSDLLAIADVAGENGVTGPSRLLAAIPAEAKEYYKSLKKVSNAGAVEKNRRLAEELKAALRG